MANFSTRTSEITTDDTQNYTAALSALTVLFFMMGFITCLNDILIPYLKGAFKLNYAQSMLVQSCFFGAYFFMSIPASLVVERLGYKRAMMLGFGIAGVGCLLFYPASVMRVYALFLLALFVLASGITLLQVAGNPYVAILGKPATASARLTLTQAFNSLGTTLAPWFGANFILSMMAKGDTTKNLQAVQLPYIGLAMTLFVIAILMFFLNLPALKAQANPALPTQADKDSSIWQFQHLVAGIAGIFCYVGAEVAIGSFLTNYIQETAKLSEELAGKYLIFYWGGAMVGRFLGAGILSAFRPAHVLLVNALCATLLLLGGILATGWYSIGAFLSIGFFNSLMFPTIFTLAVKDLGKYTNQGAGLLSTAIVGGAIVPLLQGVLADSVGAQMAYSLPILCYLYIAWFAWRGYKLR